MKITLLGTGDAAGTPQIGCKCAACMDAISGGRSRRTRFSVMVENELEDGSIGRVLVDTGPDLRQQMIEHGFSHVDGVIWTHGHYDHYAGFGEFHRVQSHVHIHGLTDTMDYILNYLGFMKPVRYDHEEFETFSLIGLDFTLFPVHHPPLVQSSGVMISDGEHKTIITGDTTNNLPDASYELMKDADLLIIDALAPPKYNFVKHMNATEAEELAGELNAKRVVMVHLSHMFKPHDEAVNRWPLGYDGMVIEV
ncbi:MAG: MBL fold metallo-hydrolase [Methanosarcinales archaeon]|nr:MBL fold metallo-hydrolase [Methanosarcinales archaeon]